MGQARHPRVSRQRHAEDTALVGTIIIDYDGVDRAKSEWNVVCFQATKDLSLQAIAAATLYDKYEKVDEQWRLVERREDLELIGDLSHHVRFEEVNS